MDNRINISNTTTKKIPAIFRRAFKRVANASEQLEVDADIRAMAKRHRAVSLFAPTFKSWNR